MISEIRVVAIVLNEDVKALRFNTSPHTLL